MALDATVLAEIREWIGSTPSSVDVEVVYDRCGTVHATALSILKARRADLEAGPDSFEVVGDYKETTVGKAFESLNKRIADLEALTGTAAPLTAGQLVRTDVTR